MYAWIAANYAAGKLRSPSLDPLETIGVLEMGGASMQATFVPGGAVPAEFEYRLELAGRSYLLYAHSFLVRLARAAAEQGCCSAALISSRNSLLREAMLARALSRRGSAWTRRGP